MIVPLSLGCRFVPLTVSNSLLAIVSAQRQEPCAALMRLVIGKPDRPFAWAR
jgi:hypothetical protein